MEITPPGAPAMVADWAIPLMLKPVPPPRNTNSSGPRTVINGRMPDWLRDDIATLAGVPEGGGGTPYKGRDDALNAIAFNAATDPSVDRNMLRQALVGACMINGFLTDEGPDYVERKIDHAFADADNNLRPRSMRFEVPDLPEFEAPDRVAAGAPSSNGQAAQGAQGGRRARCRRTHCASSTSRLTSGPPGNRCGPSTTPPCRGWAHHGPCWPIARHVR